MPLPTLPSSPPLSPLSPLSPCPSPVSTSATSLCACAPSRAVPLSSPSRARAEATAERSALTSGEKNPSTMDDTRSSETSLESSPVFLSPKDDSDVAEASPDSAALRLATRRTEDLVTGKCARTPREALRRAATETGEQGAGQTRRRSDSSVRADGQKDVCGSMEGARLGWAEGLPRSSLKEFGKISRRKEKLPTEKGRRLTPAPTTASEKNGPSGSVPQAATQPEEKEAPERQGQDGHIDAPMRAERRESESFTASSVVSPESLTEDDFEIPRREASALVTREATTTASEEDEEDGEAGAAREDQREDKKTPFSVFFSPQKRVVDIFPAPFAQRQHPAKRETRFGTPAAASSAGLRAALRGDTWKGLFLAAARWMAVTLFSLLLLLAKLACSLWAALARSLLPLGFVERVEGRAAHTVDAVKGFLLACRQKKRMALAGTDCRSAQSHVSCFPPLFSLASVPTASLSSPAEALQALHTTAEASAGKGPAASAEEEKPRGTKEDKEVDFFGLTPDDILALGESSALSPPAPPTGGRPPSGGADASPLAGAGAASL
ncbi:hypothetical protein BESB_026710 [Besnoitia besnoiti]|uniref:Uncharacterized protein n=1 Tax=Besnoitia besnoiti TaxID=94643 RepID=A0A2A9M7R7_BESBE|nr:uncharacterized protein BESB_026710 [Besnoitia besnoiti]PFH31697.1 hypothetical protein BESB_026710 [Besnoitia besnoiti]